MRLGKSWIIFAKIIKSIFTDRDRIFDADVYRLFPEVSQNENEYEYTFNDLISGYKNITFKYQCFILADRNIENAEYLYNQLDIVQLYEYVLLNKIHSVIKEQNEARLKNETKTQKQFY